MLAAIADSPLLLQAGAVPDDVQVDCRTDSCKVEVDFPSRSMAEDWANLFPLAIAGDLQQFEFSYDSQPDGRTRITTFGSVRQAPVGQASTPSDPNNLQR